MDFKGISLAMFDAILVNGGERQKPKRKFIEYGTLPGSSVPLSEDTAAFEAYQRKVEILFKDRSDEAFINQWLDGSGTLIIEDGGFYKARVVDVETLTKPWNLNLMTKIITFEVEPFFFLYSNDIVLTSGQTVFNPGVESNPYIKITGTGSVTLTVNAVPYVINPIDQFIEIEFPFAWKATTPKGRTLLNGFPKLQPGNNVISWTGSVTEVKLNGRWRTL